jgi:hypothetical protein
MEPPLKVVTGHDEHRCNTPDRPMIVVFDSTSNANKSRKGKAPNHCKPYAWIEVSTSENSVAETRKLVRSYVMQDYVRKRRENTTKTPEPQCNQKHRRTQ